MKLNIAQKFTEKTHEGARAARMNTEQALRRSVLSCLLWEREFYEEGEDIVARIVRLAGEVSANALAKLTVEARSTFNLRHVPLMLLSAAAKHKKLKAETVASTIQRADELAELLVIHAKANGITPDKLKGHIPNQMKLGLATAFGKFNEYALAKYDRAGAVRLRDVLFLCHAKPKDDEQAALWKRLVANELVTPDTWEVALSGGADKKEAFTRLLSDGKLGYLALLRNLRNMTQAGVDTGLIRDAIIARKGGAERVLPFRYVAAARACPQMEPALDQALSETILSSPIFSGKTAILVDVSGSMNHALSSRSDLKRMDAAAALASMIHGDRRVFSFSDNVVEVPPRNGMAGVDAIVRSQPHSGTALFDAVAAVNAQVPHDRMIVITDEQANGPTGSWGYNISGAICSMPAPVCKYAYVINVASAQNGVGYGPWTHIDGFSEAVLRFIHEHEADDARAI
jgi:60 kDa SS-A/Ro ribonucleoprotein